MTIAEYLILKFPSDIEEVHRLTLFVGVLAENPQRSSEVPIVICICIFINGFAHAFPLSINREADADGIAQRAVAGEYETGERRMSLTLAACGGIVIRALAIALTGSAR